MEEIGAVRRDSVRCIGVDIGPAQLCSLIGVPLVSAYCLQNATEATNDEQPPTKRSSLFQPFRQADRIDDKGLRVYWGLCKPDDAVW